MASSFLQFAKTICSIFLTQKSPTTPRISSPNMGVQDEWVESESASCLRACTCPEDDSACQLAPGCSPERFSCKAGHARFSNGEAKCYPVGCQDGALQVGLGHSVAILGVFNKKARV